MACQKLIFTNPNITGINQFHNNIVGNAINIAINAMLTIATKAR